MEIGGCQGAEPEGDLGWIWDVDRGNRHGFEVQNVIYSNTWNSYSNAVLKEIDPLFKY